MGTWAKLRLLWWEVAEAETEVPLGMSMEAALTLFKDVNNA